jgi:hypothetical protein
MNKIQISIRQFLLVPFLAILLFSTKTYTQDNDPIAWLNDNTVTTHRDGASTYDITFVFTEKGMEYEEGNRSLIIPWEKVVALAETKSNKVYVAYIGHYGDDTSPFEYVTPKQGVSATEVLAHIYSTLKNLGYRPKLFGLLNDADAKYH